jgi:hypothetical protein
VLARRRPLKVLLRRPANAIPHVYEWVACGTADSSLTLGMIKRGIIAEIPRINIVTTGCTGIFRLRRRMRSDFAQDDRGELHSCGTAKALILQGLEPYKCQLHPGPWRLESSFHAA